MKLRGQVIARESHGNIELLDGIGGRCLLTPADALTIVTKMLALLSSLDKQQGVKRENIPT